MKSFALAMLLGCVAAPVALPTITLAEEALPAAITAEVLGAEEGDNAASISAEGCCRGTCGLPRCSCCDGPRWSVSADAVFLSRTAPDPVVVAYAYESGGGPYEPFRELNANDLVFPLEAGPRLRLRRHLVEGDMIELAYFGIDDYRTVRLLESPWDGYVVARTPTTGMGFGGNGIQSVSILYGSRLYTAEANYWYTTCRVVNPFIGFRWVELDEIHAPTFPRHGPEHDPWYNLETINQMYGFQAGLDAKVWNRRRLCVDALLKAGIYTNHARMIKTNYPNGDPYFYRVSRYTANSVAFLGEIELTARYAVTERLSFRLGYQLLWLSAVALAPEQIPAENQYPWQVAVDTDGAAFYHGAVVGLEVQF